MTTGYFLTSHPSAVTHSRLTIKTLLSSACAASAPAASAPSLTHSWPPAQLPAQLGTQGQRGQAMVAVMFSRMAQLRCPGAPTTQHVELPAKASPGAGPALPKTTMPLAKQQMLSEQEFSFPSPPGWVTPLLVPGCRKLPCCCQLEYYFQLTIT